MKLSFTEITYRFQTARPEVRQLLLQYILPWLHNMELVDPNISPMSSHSSYYQVQRSLFLNSLFVYLKFKNFPIILLEFV